MTEPALGSISITLPGSYAEGWRDCGKTFAGAIRLAIEKAAKTKRRDPHEPLIVDMAGLQRLADMLAESIPGTFGVSFDTPAPESGGSQS